MLNTSRHADRSLVDGFLTGLKVYLVALVSLFIQVIGRVIRCKD